jgi:hypothetical protein
MHVSGRFVLIANPTNRRAAFFQAALARAGLPPAIVVPWLDLLEGRASLARVAALAQDGALVRLESPGEDPAVERALIARGAGAADPEGDEGMAPRLAADAARTLADEPGRLRHPRQWYLGLRDALLALEAALAEVRVLSAPADVAVLFDKRACHARLAAAGVPVAPALAPGARVRGYDDLRARMAAAGRRRVFVKLACGSSASGVVALETRDGGRGPRVLARTTVERVVAAGEERLYNSLRVRRLADEGEVAAVVDALCREGAHVEAWLPKAGLDGRTFDLRVVVIAGRARHVVVRASRGPLTNLHLGNRRGDLERVRERLGAAAWARALGAAAAALACFPRTTHAGVDVLVGSSFRTHAVLEVNAFGDLLPNVFHEGQDTYGAELEAALGRRLPPAPVTSPLGPHLPALATLERTPA